MDWKHAMRRFSLAVVGAGILGIMAVGSGPTFQSLTNMSRVPIEYGTLVNENVRIESYGSEWYAPWSVGGGEDFKTPFSVYWWSSQGPDIAIPPTNDYIEAHEAGARQVKIFVDGHDGPLYGLIVFNDAIESAFGPAKQSYYLKIPEDKLREAMNGNISVAYERMQWKDEYINDYGRQSKDKRWFSWILWMSKTPLVSPGGRDFGP